MNGTRRDFLRMGLIGGGALAWTAMRGSAAAPQSRPNIVFIMADDHAREAISCYGSRTMSTPQIDRIAQGGMRFTHMTATNSLCAPSRAVLLTGLYSHNNGFRMNGDQFDGTQRTFPKLLQAHGYATAIVGKWHLRTEPTGFDHYDVLHGQGQYFDCPFKTTGCNWEDGVAAGLVREGYVTDVITDRAIAWLDNRPRNKPFCLMVHHKAPHSPHESAPRFARFLEDETIPEPPTLLDDYAGRAPESIADEIDASRILLCHYPQYADAVERYKDDRVSGTRAMYQIFMKGYLRLVAALDENVGRLLDYLDASGLAENTIVVYTSDNGFFNGEHGFFNKMWMYEPSLHMPLLVRYPGVVGPGTVNGDLVSMADLAPTLLDLAGAAVPEGMDGVSVRPLLRGDATEFRDAVYYHYYAQYGVPEHFGIRTTTHKLVHYPGEETQVSWELFDLIADPYEMQNLADSPDHAELREKLEQRLRAMQEALKDPVVQLATGS